LLNVAVEQSEMFGNKNPAPGHSGRRRPKEFGANSLFDEVYAEALEIDHGADAGSFAARPAGLKTDQEL
jgi:hypothetical protein